MAKARVPLPVAANISDPQYEQELRELEVERDKQIATWETDLTTAHQHLSAQAFDVERHRRLVLLIEITGRFWCAKEEAYFRCRQRNRHRLHSGPGRPPKHFRWFRTIPTTQEPRSGRRRVDVRDEPIVKRTVALIPAGVRQRRRGAQRAALTKVLLEEIERESTTEQTFKARRDLHMENVSETRAVIRAVESLDRARFGRLLRAVSRALTDRQK